MVEGVENEEERYTVDGKRQRYEEERAIYMVEGRDNAEETDIQMIEGTVQIMRKRDVYRWQKVEIGKYTSESMYDYICIHL